MGYLETVCVRVGSKRIESIREEVFDMAKRLTCRDVGADCDFTVCAETEQEMFRKMAEHARTDHGMNEIPKETYDKARSAMHEVERC